jgi:hypothetical protein
MSQWKVRSVEIQKIPQQAAKAVVRVTAALRLYALDAQSEISTYPQSESSYVRTGELGRFWTQKVQQRGPDLVARIGNKKRYAARVQGSQQEELFRGFGWPNIVDTNRKVWARHRPLIVAALKG